jgi:hypothetical protein
MGVPPRGRVPDTVWTTGTPFPEPIMEERGRDYERELRWRFSRLPWRRRRAYEACLHLIAVRERDLYGLDGPPAPQPTPPTAKLAHEKRMECVCADGPCDGCVEHTRIGDPQRRFMRVM